MPRALIALCLCVGLWLATAAAQAQVVPVPALETRITDVTGTLDAAAIQRIESPLAALEAGKGSQIAVLIVSSTGDETIEQYAVRAFEQWKLGRKGVDDGVLLVVAKNDRNVRIEVGYGLEGAIPDVTAYRVIQEYLVPRFRENDFAGGIEAAVGALARLIQGEALPAPMSAAGIVVDESQSNTSAVDGHADDDLISLLPFAAIGLVIGRAILLGLMKSWWRRGLIGGTAVAVVVGFFSVAGLFPLWLPLGLGLGFVVGFLFAAVENGSGGGGGGHARSGSYSGGSSRSSGGSSGWSGGGGRSGGGGASGKW